MGPVIDTGVESSPPAAPSPTTRSESFNGARDRHGSRGQADARRAELLHLASMGPVIDTGVEGYQGMIDLAQRSGLQWGP